MSLRIGKWWGGYYNTIPMDSIKWKIRIDYDHLSKANKSRNIDEILKALQESVDDLQYVVQIIDDQETKNMKWKEEFAEYKTNLVQEQTLREERKKTYHTNASQKKQTSQFTTGDKL